MNDFGEEEEGQENKEGEDDDEQFHKTFIEELRKKELAEKLQKEAG